MIDALGFLLPLITGRKCTVAVAAAEDAHVLESVEMARTRNIADFVLFGKAAKINALCASLGISAANFDIHEAGTDTEAAALAVRYAAEGHADAVMKGILETSTIIKAALDKEHGIRASGRLSHLAMFCLPKDAYHKPLFITDAAINIAPTLSVKKEIIENAVSAVKSLGLDNPKVALLAAKEKSDPNMPVTLEYDELVRMNREGWLPGCIVGGPLALDGAVSREAAVTKGIKDPVAGDADILMCPYIEVGNVLYKSLTMFTKASLGGVLLGAKTPIILTSRADSAENKLISIALGAVIGAVNSANNTINPIGD